MHFRRAKGRYCTVVPNLWVASTRSQGNKQLGETQRAPARLQAPVHHIDPFCQGRWKEKPHSKPKFISYASPWGSRRNPAPQFGALCSHSYSLPSRNVLTDGSREMEYIIALNKLTGWALGLIWWMQDQLLMQMRILIILWLPCFSVSEHIYICIQLKSEINNETQRAFRPSVRDVHVLFFRARILL